MGVHVHSHARVRMASLLWLLPSGGESSRTSALANSNANTGEPGLKDGEIQQHVCLKLAKPSQTNRSQVVVWREIRRAATSPMRPSALTDWPHRAQQRRLVAYTLGV